LRQGAVEVTMITVDGNPKEMPCVPEDLHYMLEEGVELIHGRAMTAVLGNVQSRSASTLHGEIFRRD